MKNKYLYIALAVVPLLIGIIAVFALLLSPYTGLNFKYTDNKWYISSVDTNSPASVHPGLTGKEVISIAGRQVRKYDLEKEFDDIPTPADMGLYWETRSYFSQHIKTNIPFTITINDNGKLSSFNIIPSAFDPIKTGGKIFLFFFIALVHIALGLLVVFKKHDDKAARMFFFSMVLLALIQIPLGVLHATDIATSPDFLRLFFVIHASMNITGTIALTHFLLIFPRDVYIHKYRWFLPFLYSISVAVLFIYLFRLIPYIHYVFVIFCITLNIVFGVANYLNLNPLERTQIKWFFIGFGLFMFIDLFVYLLPPVFIGHRLMHEGDILLVVLLFPLSLVFAIMKYRLMDIDTLFDNTIIYVTTLVLLAVMDIAAIATLVNLNIIKLYSVFTLVISVWLIAFTYIPVRNMVHRYVKKLLKRETYNINTVSMELSGGLLTAPDIEVAYTRVISAINAAVHPKGDEFSLFDQHGYIRLGESSILDAAQIGGINTPTHLYNVVDSETLPKNYSGGVCVPITGSSGKLGCIILQDKHSGRLYDSDDLKLLSIAASQFAMTIEALRSREALHKKEIEMIVEKERISRELHDGIGSSLVQARLLINSNKENGMKLRELQAVVDDGIREMRELVWVVEKGESTLADLVFYVENKLAGLKKVTGIDIKADIQNENTPLSPVKKLNIIRIVQEAVANAIKHAQAESITIEFRERDNILVMNITDNGKGFDLAQQKQGSYGLRNMRKRCAEMGGVFNIASETGRGTTISVELNIS